MKTHAEKTAQKRNQSVANVISRKGRTDTATLPLLDNRSGAVAQRKLLVKSNEVVQLMAKQSPKDVATAEAHANQKNPGHLQHLLAEVEARFAPPEEEEHEGQAMAAGQEEQERRPQLGERELQEIRKEAIQRAGGKQQGERGTLYIFPFNERYHISVELETLNFHISDEQVGQQHAGRRVYDSTQGAYAGGNHEIEGAIARAHEIVAEVRHIFERLREERLERAEREKQQRAVAQERKGGAEVEEELRKNLNLGKGAHQELLMAAVKNGWSAENLAEAMQHIKNRTGKRPGQEEVLQLQRKA